MKTLRKGAEFYTVGRCTVEVNFPNGDICCWWCDFRDKITRLDKDYCIITKRTLYNLDVCPSECPLIIDKKNE